MYLQWGWLIGSAVALTLLPDINLSTNLEFLLGRFRIFARLICLLNNEGLEESPSRFRKVSARQVKPAVRFWLGRRVTAVSQYRALTGVGP